MPKPYDPAKVTTPAKRRIPRIMGSLIGQREATQICPDTPRLSGKLAVVTGGAKGIGAAISTGLAARGADVIGLARGAASAAPFFADLEQRHGVKITFISMDLGDGASVTAAISQIDAMRNGRAVDVLCANAGVSPKGGAKTAEGYEQGFAVNCLGHHRLVQGLRANGMLSPAARIIATTGDIYCLADDCSPDFVSKGPSPMAYARSKLGNIWQFRELAARTTDLKVTLVHPGVVATELEGGLTGLVGTFKRWAMISPDLGAQASLIAATQDLPAGAYFHNTRGVMRLNPDDPANDLNKQAAFFELLESLR